MGALSPRARRWMLLVCALAVAVLAYDLAYWAHLDRTDVLGSDFSASYVAGTVWLHAGNLYDQALEIARHTALIPTGYHVDLPFITPPLTAVLVAPLTALDLPAAYRVFSLLQLLLLAGAVLVAMRNAPWPEGAGPWLRRAAVLAALAGAGAWRLTLLGQWDGVSALSLALAYAAWRRGDRGRAGAWLIGGALIAKPHLALGLAVWLLAQRNRRALAGAAAAAVGVVAATLLLAGPAAIGGWIGSLRLSAGHSSPSTLSGLTGLFGSWIGSDATVQVLGAVGSVLALGACGLLAGRARQRPGLLEPSLAGATALSLLAAPHALTHDLALLAPALVWTVAWVARGPLPLRGLAIVAAGWVLLDLAARSQLDNSITAFPGRLVPLLLVAAAAAAAHACGLRLPGRRGAAAPMPLASSRA
jgi:hypothetical protein